MWNMIGTATAFLIGLGMIAGAFAIGSDWAGNVRANDLPRLSIELGQKLYQTYSMRPGIFGTSVIADTTIINMNLTPADFIDAANDVLVNPYAGDITVTGAGPRVHIDHDGIPQAACIDMLKNIGQGRGIETVRVASSIGGLAGGTPQTLPIDDTSTLCTADPMAVRFTIRY